MGGDEENADGDGEDREWSLGHDSGEKGVVECVVPLSNEDDGGCIVIAAKQAESVAIPQAWYTHSN
jgi:hypothetical protein